MAFFKKLKDRLFKSSSKIDEGLEAIVSEGGQAETAEPEAQASVPTLDPDAAQRAVAEKRAAQEQAALDKVQAAERAAQQALEQEARAEQVRAAEAEAEVAAQATRLAQEVARSAEEARQAAVKQAAVKQAAVKQDTVKQGDLKQTGAQHAADAEARRQEDAKRQVAEARAEAEQHAAQTSEAQRLAEQQAASPTPAPAPLRTTITPVTPLEETGRSAPVPKRGFLGRLMGRGADASAPVVRRVLDDAMLEQLEELLISADMGVDTALRVTANMAEGRLGKKLSVQEIKILMSDEIARIMEPVAKPLPIYAKTPQVVLVVGVNGSGKTTTIGKLASQFRGAGKKVVIAAGDTFRAAAVEQLQVWGERAGVPVLTAPQGSDPASLAFDAMVRAEADGADLLMIDTAGRLQNRGDLMEELAKIVRVIRKKDPDAPHNTLLVLDATTGQNAINQVKVFQEISDVSGLVMTKLDGTAKGGVLVSLADKFGLPIHAIGVGEQIDDLQAFDPQEFADALTGLDR